MLFISLFIIFQNKWTYGNAAIPEGMQEDVGEVVDVVADMADDEYSVPASQSPGNQEALASIPDALPDEFDGGNHSVETAGKKNRYKCI